MHKPSREIQDNIRSAIESAQRLEQQSPVFLKIMGLSVAAQIHQCSQIAFKPSTSSHLLLEKMESMSTVDAKLQQLLGRSNPAIFREIETIRNGIKPLLETIKLKSETSETIVGMDNPTLLTPNASSCQIDSLISSNLPEFLKILEQSLTREGLTKLQYIAQGGMGMVIKAREENLSRNVVIKINLISGDPAMVHKFLQEGKKAAGIGVHPNIVTVFRTGTTLINLGDRKVPIPFHVMEYVDGEDGKAMNGKDLLKKLKAAGRRMPADAALILTLQFAKGLLAAHENGIMHRDVKPENSLVPLDIQKLFSKWLKKRIDDRELIEDLKKSTGIKVSDFGLAGIRGKNNQSTNSKNAEDAGDKTMSGGTLGYMPPEGYDDGQIADKPWDVYSLGIVFYQFLTNGKMPLEHSYGIDPKSPKNFWSYMAKIAPSNSPAVAGPEKDPEIDKLLAADPENFELLELMQNMTAHQALDRQTLMEAKSKLEEIIDKRSEKSKSLLAEKKRSAYFLRRLKQLIALGLIAIPLGLLEHWRERVNGLEERRRVYFAMKGLLEKNLGKQCLCEYLEECQAELNGIKVDPDEIPSEKDYLAILEAAQRIDGQWHVR